MINKKVVVPLLNTYSKWKSLLEIYNIIYLFAPTGCGKTENTLEFAKREYREWITLSILQDDFYEVVEEYINRKGIGRVNRLIIIDDLQYMDIEYVDKVMSIILDANQVSNSNIRIKFILLSRAALPVYLKPLVVTRQLVVQDMKSLMFSLEETKEFINEEGIELNPYCIKTIHEITKGWAVAILLYVSRFQNGEEFNHRMEDCIARDIYDYFDETLYQEWHKDIQKFLLYMAGFSKFSITLARTILAKSEDEIREVLQKIRWNSSYLVETSKDNYSILPFFSRYLQYKQEQLLSQDAIKIINNNAGLFYELEDDIVNALSCYSKANNKEKVADLLIRNLERYASSANNRVAAKYFEQIDQEVLEQTPELLSAIAMLRSMQMRPEESEHYYNKLEELLKSVKKTDSRYRVIQEKLVYLAFALPHKGSKSLTRIFVNLASYCIKNGIHVQKVSATGNMPSLLNGGKDFCQWLRHDKMIYTFLKKPIEQVLEKSAVGLADTALGESCYVKNSIAESMSYLTKGLSDATLKGVIEMEFAAVGVMARAFMAEGSIAAAQGIVDNLECKIIDRGEIQLLPNLHAVKVQIALRTGEVEYVDDWYEREAVDEMLDFYINERYQLMTKAKVYIYKGKFLEAYSLLKRLEYYAHEYERRYIGIQVKLLLAVVLERRNEEWLPLFVEALSQASRYELVRLVADEGAAVSALFNTEEFKSCNPKQYKIEATFLKKVKVEVKKQTDLYPNYLKSLNNMVVLSKQEKSIFKQIALGKTNEEIADLLKIKVSTVKFHVSNIFKKLQVNNRAMAIKEGKDRGLV